MHGVRGALLQTWFKDELALIPVRVSAELPGLRRRSLRGGCRLEGHWEPAANADILDDATVTLHAGKCTAFWLQAFAAGDLRHVTQATLTKQRTHQHECTSMRLRWAKQTHGQEGKRTFATLTRSLPFSLTHFSCPLSFSDLSLFLGQFSFPFAITKLLGAHLERKCGNLKKTQVEAHMTPHGTRTMLDATSGLRLLDDACF